MNRFFFLLLFFSILLNMGCASPSNMKQEEMILRITFANGFSNDTLSVNLNSCELVKTFRLSSPASRGFFTLKNSL